MKYRATRHFLQRLEDRNITESQVEEGLRNIVMQWEDPRQGSVALSCLVGTKTLVIWVVGRLPLREPLTIKSAAWRE